MRLVVSWYKVEQNIQVSHHHDSWSRSSVCKDGQYFFSLWWFWSSEMLEIDIKIANRHLKFFNSCVLTTVVYLRRPWMKQKQPKKAINFFSFFSVLQTHEMFFVSAWTCHLKMINICRDPNISRCFFENALKDLRESHLKLEVLGLVRMPVNPSTNVK